MSTNNTTSTPVRIYLYIVSFYYCFFCPSFHNRDSEVMAWSAMVGSGVHALIWGALALHVDWIGDLFGLRPWDGFDDALWQAGLPMAAWVMIGFLHTPALDKMHEEDDYERQRFIMYNGGTPEQVKRWNLEKEELKKIEEQDPEKYRNMVQQAREELANKEPDSQGYTVFKNYVFMHKELERLWPGRYEWK